MVEPRKNRQYRHQTRRPWSSQQLACTFSVGGGGLLGCRTGAATGERVDLEWRRGPAGKGGGCEGGIGKGGVVDLMAEGKAHGAPRGGHQGGHDGAAAMMVVHTTHVDPETAVCSLHSVHVWGIRFWACGAQRRRPEGHAAPRGRPMGRCQQVGVQSPRPQAAPLAESSSQGVGWLDSRGSLMARWQMGLKMG